jgi:hypothetical protein
VPPIPVLSLLSTLCSCVIYVGATSALQVSAPRSLLLIVPIVVILVTFIVNAFIVILIRIVVSIAILRVCNRGDEQRCT